MLCGTGAYSWVLGEGGLGGIGSNLLLSGISFNISGLMVTAGAAGKKHIIHRLL
jgi:hypothetical protein